MRLSAALLLATIALAGDPDHPVRGRLLGEDGEPVRGATIRMNVLGERHEVRAESLADGTFALEAAPGTEVEICALAPGYQKAWFRGRVYGERPLELRVRRGTSLRVRVEDATGRPIAGATVGLFKVPRVVFVGGGYPTYLRIDRKETTGPDGACELTLVERGYDVAAVAEGHGGAAASALCGMSELRLVLRGQGLSRSRFVYAGLPGIPDLQVPDDPPPPEADAPPEPAAEPPTQEETEPEPEPVLEEGAKTAHLRVRVLSADGVPVPGAHVDARWALEPERAHSICEGYAGPEYRGFKFASGDGKALIVLDPGRYQVEASPYGFGTEAATVREEVAIRAGERREIEIRLPNIFSAAVEVVDADGKPMPSVDLEVQRGGDRDTFRTGPDGRATFLAQRRVPCRVLAVPVKRPSASSGPIELPLKAPVVLKIPRPGLITGRIVDPDGTPLFGVAVVLRREGLEAPDEEEWTAWTDERGEFSCEGPSEGAYTATGCAWAYQDTAVQSVCVPAKERVEIRLRRMPRIAGCVVGPAGEPLSDVLVQCDDGKTGIVCTAADGSFALAYGYDDAETTLSFTLDGFETREIRVNPASAGKLDVALQRAPK